MVLTMLLTALFGFIILQDVIANFIPIFSYFDEVLTLIILSLLVLKIIKTKTIQKSTLVIIVFLSIYIFISLVSSLKSDQPIEYAILGIFLNIKFFLVIIGLKEFNISSKIYLKVIKVITYYAILSCFFAIIDLLFPYILRESLQTFNRIDIRSGLISIQSFFIHPGVYGWFMIFAAILNFAVYEYYNKKKINLFLTIIFLFFAILSLRFKVILGIILVLAIKIKRTPYHPVIKILPSLIILFTFLILNRELIELTFNRYISADVFVSARKALYVFAPIIASSYFPFGSGIGTFGSWYSRINYSDLYYEYNLYRVQGLQPHFPDWITDTYWPSILAESGYIGLFILLSLNIYFLWYLYRMSKQKYDFRYIYFAALFVLLYTLIESLGEQIFNSSPQFLLIGIIVGMALKPYKEIEQRTEI